MVAATCYDAGLLIELWTVAFEQGVA
jgi:hypothetical protein